MGLRYVLWHLAFGKQLGFGGECALYAAYVAIGSTYIFTNFAVSHTHKDVIPKDKNISWALYSANHTTNCTPGYMCNWWMAYLNFQIEHHLFPAMPQFNHPKICHRVKASSRSTASSTMCATTGSASGSPTRICCCRQPTPARPPSPPLDAEVPSD